MTNQQRGLLIDITQCAGCRACMEACMESHGQAGDPFEMDDLSADNNTVVLEKGDLFIRRQCMHCQEPSCASVCPVGALQKTPEGPVVYDSARCIGCRYCMQACPFHVPRYQWSSNVPAMVKCDGCIDRIRRGDAPACAEACPAGGVVAGTRAELLEEAHRRIAESPDAYYPHVYGEKEVGGTSVLYLSPVEFSTLGFNVGLGETPLSVFTQQALNRIPCIVNIGGAALLGIWWITRRREAVRRAEAAGTAPLPQESAEASS
jgi:formate dehydrogenase iron-sulfur subunit